MSRPPVHEELRAPEGIDALGVKAWFDANVPAARPPLRFAPIAGGRSNLTYQVRTIDGRGFVLRRPPLAGLLPSAHDMSRECRILNALARSPVPVPPVVGLCTDEAVNGAPFYVMDFVDGLVLRDSVAAEAVTEPVRRAAADSLVDVLAALHNLDPATVGLGDLARTDGYVERLLRRWLGQWERSKTRELPLIVELARRLTRTIPTQGQVSIVHGDYRLDNVILSPEDGTVRAVLDWELCTLGDPLADLGMLLMYWTRSEDDCSPLLSPPTTAAGFPGRTDIAARYAARSGRDLSEIDFYIALALWKGAVILEGVYARYASGAYGDTDGSWQRFEALVPQLAEAAHVAATRAGR
jgi:aminoglycoside phosphotransferase (APT) family kinase protein